MRYRKLDANGDYVLGQGADNFYYGIDAVVQAIKTRMALLQGTFWRDLSDGFPLFQNVLGQPGSEANQKAIDTVTANRITGTTGVNSLISYSNTFDSSTRTRTYEATVDTVYSAATVTGNL